jgi:hypothetical protein
MGLATGMVLIQQYAVAESPALNGAPGIKSRRRLQSAALLTNKAYALFITAPPNSFGCLAHN